MHLKLVLQGYAISNINISGLNEEEIENVRSTVNPNLPKYPRFSTECVAVDENINQTEDDSENNWSWDAYIYVRE